MPDRLRIGIAGAGLLGRLLAWRLSQAGHRVSVFDPAVDERAVVRSQAPEPYVPTAAGFTAAGIVARISPEGDLQTLAPGSVAAAGAMSPVASRTGPSPACVGCGTMTIGGTGTVSVGPGVIGGGPPQPTPPPVSGVRPGGGI